MAKDFKMNAMTVTYIMVMAALQLVEYKKDILVKAALLLKPALAQNALLDR